MADIVSTLFGLPSLDSRATEEQARTRDYTTGAQFGAAFINPYGDPRVAELEQKQFASQFSLGGALGRGVGSLFGLQTPEQKRVKDLQDVLKTTQEEVGSQDPAVLYPAMSKKLADMGYGEEAFKVGQAGQSAKMEQGKAVGDMAYKKAMIDYYQLLGANQKAAEESKLMEQRGQIANGALTQIEGITDPEVADKVWNATLVGLKAKGLDISSLADLPPAERAKALQGIVDSSENSATRTKAQISEATLAMKEKQFEEKMAMEETKNTLKAAIANLQADMRMYAADSATARAMNSKVDNFSNQLKLLTIKEANDTQAGYASAVGTKEFNKDIDSYLRESVGLKDKDQIRNARTEFSTVYRELLGRKNEEGFPLYNNIEALNRAKKYIEDKTGEESTYFGLGSKPKFDSKAAPVKKPIKLD